MDLMTAIAGVPGVGPFLPYLAAAVAVCAALAPFLPPPGANAAYATFYRIVNAVALNMGHAKNANAPGAASPSAPVVLALLCAAALALAACTQTGAVKPVTLDLAHAQQIAVKLDADVKLAADTALASGLVPPAQRSMVLMAEGALDDAVKAFNGVSGAAPGQVDPRELAKAVLTAADGVVQLVPAIPSTVKIGVDVGTGLVLAFINSMPVTLPAA